MRSVTQNGVMLDLITIVLITVGISAIALLNGFPLVYADTGTYLLSAIDHVVPVDRPYWYGVFLRWTSVGGWSLWLPVIVQALICALLILRLLRLHGRGEHRVAALTTAVVLGLGTGLGWYAGQLMPDVFIGIGTLALLLLWTDLGSRPRTCGYASLVILGCWLHSSNLIILTLVAILFIPTLTNRRLALRPQWLIVLLTMGTAWGGLLLVNRIADGEAYLAKGGHVFLMGRMIDSGMLPVWLDEHCPQQELELCTYRETLPANSQEFLWDANSPLQRMGGWEATCAEYGRIVRASLTQPRYLLWHVRDGLRSTGQQLGLWTVGHRLQGNWYREADSPPYRVIATRLPQHLSVYRASRQNTLPDGGAAVLHSADLRYRITMVMTAALLAAALVPSVRRRLGPRERMVLAFVIVAVLMNCAVCAGLSVADDRFLSRISWILPLAVMLCIAHLRGGRKAPKGDQAVSV